MPNVVYKIREKREEKGLRQQDVAEALNIRPHNVSCWERGEYNPSKKHLAELCSLLRCQPSDLITFDTAD